MAAALLQVNCFRNRRAGANVDDADALLTLSTLGSGVRYRGDGASVAVVPAVPVVNVKVL